MLLCRRLKCLVDSEIFFCCGEGFNLLAVPLRRCLSVHDDVETHCLSKAGLSQWNTLEGYVTQLGLKGSVKSNMRVRHSDNSFPRNAGRHPLSKTGELETAGSREPVSG